MHRIILLAALLFAFPAQAQLALTGAGKASAAAPLGYTGPGDVLSGASAFWGLRGYNNAFSGAVANICDVATGATCADATWAAGVLTLPTIGGSPCDNSGNTCQVKTLYDQSGALACAGSTACDLTNATAGRRPTLIVAGAANGCPSTAFPCMSFVRASQQCLFKASTYTQAQPFSGVFVGIRTGTTGSTNTAFIAGTPFLGWAAANLLRITAGTVQTIAGNDSVWHAVQGIWSNSVGALSADGSTTTANNGTSAPSSSSLIVGAGSTSCATNPLDGKLTEFGIWPLDFTASIAALNTNAHSYWGF